MKLSIIIPVYKGENTLIPLFVKIKETLEGKFDYEVLFISDNAIDDSWSKIQYLQKNYSHNVKGYKLKWNYGQHRALLFGLKVATGNYMVTLDEDMQHDPAYIPAMLTFLLENNLDVVYGKFLEFKKERSRKFGSLLGRRVAVLLIPSLYKEYSPFRIIRSEIAEVLDGKKSVVLIDALIGSATSEIGIYPITHFETRRPSSYSFCRLILLAATVVLWYSRKARFLFYSIILFLIYFGSGPITELSGSSFSITGLISLSVLALILSFTLFVVVKNKSMAIIKVAETT